MPRNEQAKSSTLRNRQRITNKTRLKVIHGPIDADPVIIGEDDDRGINKSTAGVDADDAAEHHLQQVLNAANAAQRASTTTTSHASSTAAATTGTALAPPPPPADTFIPTPDAQGIVANYEDMYPKRKFKPLSIQRFSDSPEESIRWGLQPKSYTMDERDTAWLEQHNQQARGEGTSASGGGSAHTSPRRSSKKGKEPEDFSPIVMTEDEFELVMGLFEKYTSDHLPYLHLDATLQSIPPFSLFEAFTASPLPPSIFATFLVPSDIPEPDKLFRLAQSIHPHWHLRRVERKGRSIIPDINLDEAEEGNVYVCFRRREVKAVRKTRRMEITSVEKLTRLNVEFEIALELVDKVVEREEIKREICVNDANIWGRRSRMIAVTNKFPNLRSPEDEKYLIDKEKIKRKPLGVDTTNILRIPRGGLPSAGALFSAGGLRTGLLHEEEQDLGQAIVHPRERYEQIQKLIEGDLHTKNEAMYGMEDHTDMPFQQQYAPGQRSFKNLGSAPADEGVPPLERMPVPPAFRHRVGRGGRRHLDRRFPPFTKAPLASRPHPAPFSTKPVGATVFSSPPNGVVKPTPVPFFLAFPHARFLAVAEDGSKGNGEDEKPDAKRRRVQEAEEMDRARKIEERWKFDADGPRLGDVEDRVIVDDFNIQSQMMRAQLIREAEYLVQPDYKMLLNHFELGNSEMSKKLLEAHREELRQLRILHSLSPEQQRSVAMSKMQQKQQLLISMGLLQIQQPILPPGMMHGPVQPPNGLVPGHVQRPLPNVMMGTAGAQPQTNGQGQMHTPSSQPSSQQLNGTSVPTSAPVPPQVQMQGTPQLPQQSPVGAVGAVSTPPLKPLSNGTNHLSPSNNAALVTGSLADTGPTVRVSTPIRKLMSGTPQPINGFPNSAPLQPQQLFHGAPGMNGMNGMNVQMLLQQQKLAQAHAQQMQLQQQQQMQHQIMVEQAQQQQQQTQALQQHQANMIMNGIGVGMNGMNGMNGMSGAPQVAGMIPINSAINMSVQNMNLALGNPNLQLHLAPNRMQRAQQQANFAAALGMNGMNGIGPGAGMGMNVNVNGMAMNGMSVNGLQQAQHGMSISRAPSVHPGMHSMMHPGMNGMNGMNGMHMRPPSAMSPMMRPPSTAPSNSGVHSVMPSPSLRPTSVSANPHGSPARPPQVVPPPQS